MTKCEKLICAIDHADQFAAANLVASVRNHVGAIKLGLEFFTANGTKGVREIAKYNAPVFLDLKFHDIPNTVSAAVAAAVKLGAFMLTVHSAGGPEMMRAAADAASETAESTGRARPLVIGVTVLTSLDNDDMKSICYKYPVRKQARRLADLAKESGLDGVVCSPHEIRLIRKQCGDDFTLVVPGIRPKDSPNIDQKRVMTPEEALGLGADYLVIGRPISGAKDPNVAVRRIVDGIENWGIGEKRELEN